MNDNINSRVAITATYRAKNKTVANVHVDTTAQILAYNILIVFSIFFVTNWKINALTNSLHQTTNIENKQHR